MRRALRRGLAAAVLAGLIAGCAAPGVRPALQSTTLARHVELTDTPFHPQEKYQCGPAALATVLGASGVDVAPEKLTDQVYVPARKGSLQIEMLAAARRNGTLAFVIPNRLEALLEELEAGNPVLVLLNLGLSWIPSWHYAVAIGYDLDRAEVMLRSGTMERQVMSLDTFMHTWNRSERWAFVTMPPGRVAHSVSEQSGEEATLAFARVADPRAAYQAYEAALRRWPDNLPLAIGLGNTAYRSGDLEGARRAFETASRRHPEDGAVLNNLAYVLARQGRTVAARKLAQRALGLGERWQDETLETLRMIDALEKDSKSAGRRPKRR